MVGLTIIAIVVILLGGIIGGAVSGKCEGIDDDEKEYQKGRIK